MLTTAKNHNMCLVSCFLDSVVNTAFVQMANITDSKEKKLTKETTETMEQRIALSHTRENCYMWSKRTRTVVIQGPLYTIRCGGSGCVFRTYCSDSSIMSLALEF
jgi:hypothetical protein